MAFGITKNKNAIEKLKEQVKYLKKENDVFQCDSEFNDKLKELLVVHYIRKLKENESIDFEEHRKMTVSLVGNVSLLVQKVEIWTKQFKRDLQKMEENEIKEQLLQHMTQRQPTIFFRNRSLSRLPAAKK